MVDNEMFEKLDVQMLAISADPTFSQKMFAQSIELNYPVLSDHPDLKTIRHFDILTRIGEADRPIARGSYFLIDKEGIIRRKWMGKKGEVFPSETLLKAIREN